MKICVFCGADVGVKEEYVSATREFGKLIAELKLDVVYGGGSGGLMGVLAEAALNNGANVTGVVPEFFAGSKYKGNEVVHKALSQTKWVSSMMERKRYMMEISDAFVALPGGIGTIDELLEVWTLAKLGKHSKPCGLLNVSGFYDPFLGLSQHMVREGFLEPSDYEILIVENDGKKLLHRILNSKTDFVPSIEFQ